MDTCIGRIALELDAVIRILRMLLMEDVFPAIIPIYKVRSVHTSLESGSLCILLSWSSCYFSGTRFTFISGLSCWQKLHIVRVYDFMLFLWIERLFMVLDDSFCNFAGIFFFVVRDCLLWVRVRYKSIWASKCSSTLMSAWRSKNYKIFITCLTATVELSWESLKKLSL